MTEQRMCLDTFLRLRHLPYTPQCASPRSVFSLYREAISCKVRKTTINIIVVSRLRINYIFLNIG